MKAEKKKQRDEEMARVLAEQCDLRSKQRDAERADRAVVAKQYREDAAALAQAEAAARRARAERKKMIQEDLNKQLALKVKFGCACAFSLEQHCTCRSPLQVLTATFRALCFDNFLDCSKICCCCDFCAACWGLHGILAATSCEGPHHLVLVSAGSEPGRTRNEHDRTSSEQKSAAEGKVTGLINFSLRK